MSPVRSDPAAEPDPGAARDRSPQSGASRRLEALRQAFLRAHCVDPAADDWVLRGSVLTQSWLDVPRPAQDLDFVTTYACDVDRTTRRLHALAEAMSTPVAARRISREMIWAETPNPGMRFVLDDALQIDFGFADPVVPGPTRIACPTLEDPSLTLLAARPETMYAWKVHGLFELGRGRWHGKTLADLYLIGGRVGLEPALVVEATRVAFSSRHTPLSVADRFLAGAEWGQSRGSKRKWRTFVRRQGAPAHLPVELDEVAARVRAQLVPIFSRLLASERTSG